MASPMVSDSKLDALLARLFPGNPELGWPTFFEAVGIDEVTNLNFSRDWLESELDASHLETASLNDLIATLRASHPHRFRKFLDVAVSMYFSSGVVAEVLLRQQPSDSSVVEVTRGLA